MATETADRKGGELMSPREKQLLAENMRLKDELIPYRRGEKSWLFWIGLVTILSIGGAAIYFLKGGIC